MLTDNRSVLLSVRRTTGGPLVRLHRMFLHAPALVIAALARNIRRRGPAADGEVRRFMNENLHRVRRTPRGAAAARDARARLRPGLGVRRHQPALLRRQHAACRSPGAAAVGRARRGGLTFGSYDPVLALIRIHPVLDRPAVPRYFLESVVHHEMLHHQMGGVSDRAGRTVYHTRAFREAEARFPHHRDALAWEKAEPAGPAAREPGARPRAPRGAGGRARRIALGRARMALPQLRRLLPGLARHRRALLLGLLALALTTALLGRGPVGAAPRDRRPDARRHAAEAVALRGR